MSLEKKCSKTDRVSIGKYIKYFQHKNMLEQSVKGICILIYAKNDQVMQVYRFYFCSKKKKKNPVRQANKFYIFLSKNFSSKIY